MASLAGEQGPGATDANSVKRTAVLMLPVSIAVVAMPRWPSRRVDPQDRIDHRDRIHDPRVVGRAQTAADERQRVWADGERPARGTFRGWTVFDRHEPVLR